MLFIAGWSRCGSTLVERVLGQLDGVCATGEVTFLWDKGLIKGGRCGCGALTRDCGFWSAVLQSAFGDGGVDPQEIFGLQRKAVRIRFVPRLWWNLSRRHREDRIPYAAVLRRLYHAIGETSGDGVMIDSSKFPPDALVATTDPDVEPYVLHIVRDPRAVAYSWTRRSASIGRPGSFMPTYGPVYSSVRWAVFNGLHGLLLRRRLGDHYMLVRYEDVVKDPRRVIGRVAEMLGESPDALPFIDEQTVALEPNHTVWGNDFRFKTGKVEIRADEEWRTEMRPLARALATAPALLLLRRYGYGRLERAPAATRRLPS